MEPGTGLRNVSQMTVDMTPSSMAALTDRHTSVTQITQAVCSKESMAVLGTKLGTRLYKEDAVG